MSATFPRCSTSRSTPGPREPRRRRRRDQRGLVFPSPVVVLSIIAVAMAAIAFLATRGTDTADDRVEVTSQAAPTPAATTAAPVAPAPAPVKKKPEVNRSKIYVEVYNNSGIKGLAGGVAQKAGDAGWQVVGADNWYGTIPATTVYYPQRLERAASRLALDLGIKRKALAIDPMRADRLTVILTGPIA